MDEPKIIYQHLFHLSLPLSVIPYIVLLHFHDPQSLDDLKAKNIRLMLCLINKHGIVEVL